MPYIAPCRSQFRPYNRAYAYRGLIASAFSLPWRSAFVRGMTNNLKRHATVFINAWGHRNRLTETKRTRRELEFLPAALEVQQTPPSPIGRVILWLILSFTVIAVTWASVGEIDIVAVAHGKVIPAGKSKVIQAYEIGKVTAIHIEEGQRVKEGDLLIELDSSMTSADHTRLKQELSTELAVHARLTALVEIAEREDITSTIPSVDKARSEHIDEQKIILKAELNEYHSRLKTHQETIAQYRAEAETLKEQIKKVESIIPLINRRRDSVKNLFDKKHISETEYLKLEQERIEAVQTLAAQQSELKETHKRIDQARSQYEGYQAEFSNRLLQQKAESQRKIKGLEQELIKAATRQALLRITSPVNGQVQQLSVHTIGAVVKPAEPLMMIIPETRGLEVEAFIENKDIGFIHKAQQAEIKVDAFPFNKYGTIDGSIISLSNDAIEHEKLGWRFLARVRMEKNQMSVEGKQVNLTPGMSASVEIKTGKRRVMEFFLSPLLKGMREAVRER
ncbi:MAG: HlyD family type I secretion periplasmic adaptor subunit [Candidatus Sedimenticola sp. (ex Thyasira tokunagai)]